MPQHALVYTKTGAAGTVENSPGFPRTHVEKIADFDKKHYNIA